MNHLRTIILGASFAAILSANAQRTEPADSLHRELQEVVVNARQPATRLVGSTLISTIAGSNLQDLGNALDVLAQLPMIKVQDDAVSVIGRGNIEIYIDGRPMHDNEELHQLQSHDIKNVELLMSPGAMYESTTDAVLKITTRRRFLQGLSLNDQLKIQRRRRWSVMDYLGLSYRAGNWDFFLNGSFNHDDKVIKGHTVNSLEYQGRPTTVGSSQYNRYPTDAGSVTGGINYSKEAQSTGAYYRFNPEHGDFSNNGAEWLNDESPVSRNITKAITGHSHLVSFYYDNTFGERYNIHFDGDYRTSSAKNAVSTTYPSSPDASVDSRDRRNSTLWAGKLYLGLPLFKGNLTIGTQESYTHTSLDYRMLNTDVAEYLPSSITDARQTSVGAFASWQRSFGPFNLSAGARWEYVDYDFKVDGKRDNDLSRRDHSLTPDISLGYSFNECSQISLSYKMATVRPPYSQLTGSLNYTGRHEIEGGNPALHDERMHRAQLFASWNDFMLQGTYTRSLDTYAFVKQPYHANTLQLLLHPVNVDVSDFNLYLLWNKPIHRWTPDVTLGFSKQWLEINGTHYNRPMFFYYIDNTLTLPYGWNITANVSGQSSGDMHTNRFGATWFTMDASASKTFFDKSLTIKLSATDIFNTANNDWTMNTYGVFVDKRQSYDLRGISLGVTYRFQPRQSKYKGESAAEEELNRLH